MKRLTWLIVLAIVGCSRSPCDVTESQNDEIRLVGVAAPSAKSNLARFRYDLERISPDAKLDGAKFEIEIVPFESDEDELATSLFPTYRQALASAQRSDAKMMVSANLVDALKKEVFDSCYAALDLAIETGKTPHLSKREMVRRLRKMAKPSLSPTLDELLGGADALAEGGTDPSNARLSVFLADPMRARPIAFYGWNDALGRIFRRDRFLQSPLDLPDPNRAAVAAALRGDPELENAYRFHAEFLRVMTNPFSADSPLADVPGAKSWAILPSCRSNESELLKQCPELIDPMNEMIRRVRDGRLSLAPRADSGFYDYEQHALEGYLRAPANPEGMKVAFGKKYLERLEEAFKTGMAKARESHVKDLDVATVTCMPSPALSPCLPLEPLPTVFYRYAAALDFLLENLERLAGPETISQVRALHPDGPMRSIREELAGIRSLCYGLALFAADEIGLERSALGKIESVDEAEGVAAAKTWLSDFASDARIARDTRFAVPVSVEVDELGRPIFIHFWATFGVQILKVRVKFTQAPEGVPGGIPADYLLLVDKFLGFKRPYALGPLSREDYRAVLDRCATIGEAKAALMK